MRLSEETLTCFVVLFFFLVQQIETLTCLPQSTDGLELDEIFTYYLLPIHMPLNNVTNCEVCHFCFSTFSLLLWHMFMIHI